MVSVFAKEKKFKEPPPVYYNTKSFSASCDAAMPLLTEIGSAPQSMDRQGGFASLKWTRGENAGYGTKNDVKLLTEGDAGFWANYEVFRIETGTLFVTPEPSGCRGQIKMLYAVVKKNYLTGVYQTFAMESNNFLEQSLLNKIAEQMDTQVFAQAQANLKAPAITQPAPERSSSMATVSFASNPAGADIELGGRFIGSTPSKVDLPTGKDEVVIKKAGHRDWTRKLDFLPGANINLQAELTPGEMPVVALASPTAPALQPPLASEPSKPVPTKITAAPAKV